MTQDLAIATQKPTRLDDSLFSKELAPHYMQLASQLSKSTMVPKPYQGKPQDLFIAMAMGYQIGLSVEQAIQAIAVINGKPCLWGDDALALCMTHKDFEDIQEAPIRNSNDTVTGYVCTVKRKGMSPSIKNFTLDMAKKAGLLSKTGPWTQYPERMLQLRARAYALRDIFPDALKGIKTREEAEDYVDVEVKVVDDKVSRVEFLKKDLSTKGSQENEVMEEISNTSILNARLEAAAKAVPDAYQTRVVDIRESKNSSSDEDVQAITLTTKQHTTISRLLDEKGFSDERISKALAYYEVVSLSDLTTDLADHFIEQLEKI